MVLSHADDDHARGLIGVLKHFQVRRLWMNRPWLYCADVIDFFHGNFTVAGLEREMSVMRDRSDCGTNGTTADAA